MSPRRTGIASPVPPASLHDRRRGDDTSRSARRGGRAAHGGGPCAASRARGAAPADGRRAPGGGAGGRPLRRPGAGEGARPLRALPADVSREALLRLVERAAPRLGLPDKALRALRLVAGTCRWADFVSTEADPVCFRQARRMAEELGVSPGYWRKLEAVLERAGLIERATCENGQRGRLAGGVVAGLSLGPLVAGLERWRALAAEVEAERAALEEDRARVRIARRAARRAVEGLAEDHPARAAYEALRGAGFRPSARLRDAGAIAEHLAALEVMREAGRRAREAAGERAEDAAAGEGAPGPDDTIWSGAARAEERRHTESPKDPQTGSVAMPRAGRGGTPRTRRAGRPTVRVAERRGGEGTRPRAARGPDRTGRRDRDPGHGRRRPGWARASASRRAAAAEPARAARPRERGDAALRRPPALGAKRGRGNPQPGRDRGRRAAEAGRTRGHGPALGRGRASLGWFDALLALIVVDANHRHPTAPVRNAPGLLRDLARRGRAGTLDLGASVHAIWRREAQGCA